MVEQVLQQKTKVVGLPGIYVRDPVGLWWCRGCGYPIFQRLLCEALEEMGVADDVIASTTGGCNCGIPFGLNIDVMTGAHGRSPDHVTPVKRLRPDAFVFTIQGDGDVIAIGTEPLIQAASRGEKITVLMLNNGQYGNTGGQMAPTTIVGQVTATTQMGRNPETHGYPIRTAELVAVLPGVAYSARGALSSPANFQRTKKYLKAAFQKQVANIGFSFVEILSPCPTNWRLSPLESLKWMEEKMIPVFPLGEFKNVDKLF